MLLLLLLGMLYCSHVSCLLWGHCWKLCPQTARALLSLGNMHLQRGLVQQPQHGRSYVLANTEVRVLWNLEADEPPSQHDGLYAQLVSMSGAEGPADKGWISCREETLYHPRNRRVRLSHWHLYYTCHLLCTVNLHLWMYILMSLFLPVTALKTVKKKSWIKVTCVRIGRI